MAQPVAKSLWVIKAGIVSYDDCWHLQQGLKDARRSELISDTLLLLQHLPVVTFGRKANGNNLLMTESFLRSRGIGCVTTDRGGDITYHGPGQLVGYPIISLRDAHLTVGEYVHTLEQVIIDSLKDLGIEGRTRSRSVGVWVGERKIASIGVRVSRGVTTHGFALNVNNDLTPFQYIHPCGMEGVKMTSVEEQAHRRFSVGEGEALVISHFQRHFDRRCGAEDTLSGLN